MFTAKMSNIFITIVLLFQFMYGLLMAAWPALRQLPFSLNLFLSQVFSFIVPSFIYIAVTRQKITRVLEIKPVRPANIFYIIALSVLVQPIAMVVSALTSLLFPNTAAMALSSLTRETSPLIMIAVACITPAICEEFALRGIAAQNLKYQGYTGMFLNGLYFAMIHLNLQQFFYAFFLGLLLYHILRVSGSVLAPALAHFTINFSQTILFQLAEPLAEPAPSSSYITAIAPVFIIPLSTLLFVWTLKKFTKHNAYVAIRPAEQEPMLNPSFFLMVSVYLFIMYF